MKPYGNPSMFEIPDRADVVAEGRPSRFGNAKSANRRRVRRNQAKAARRANRVATCEV